MLKSRVVLITGASAGIGAAVARDIVAQGGRVVVNARREQNLAALVESCNEERMCAVSVPGDASEPSVIEEMFRAAEEQLGAPADAMIVNAGRGLGGSTLTSDEAQWEEVVKINLLGAARAIRRAAACMTAPPFSDYWPSQARDIVVLGSVVGRHVSPFSSLYGSTKFAVNSLAEATRRELGPQGIRVTLVEPAVVRSEFQSAAGYSDTLVEDFESRFGPLLVPEDIARAISFVLSQPPHVHMSDIVVRSTRQDYP